jgi:hypothetical protein
MITTTQAGASQNWTQARLGAPAQLPEAAHAQAEALEKQLRTLVKATAPVLLAQPGVGPITAAQLLISWSHPGRGPAADRVLHTSVMIPKAWHEPTNAVWPAAPPRARASVRSAATLPVRSRVGCIGCASARPPPPRPGG